MLKKEMNTNPYSKLSDEELKEMCGVLQQKDSCLCAGKKSTHAWYTHAVNNSTHHGPGCEDTITYGDGEECLLATMCHNKFPDIKLPLCRDGNSCMYPLWIGEGSGLEILQSPEKYKCNDWDCVINNIELPPRWHDGQNPRTHINQWKQYCENLKKNGEKNQTPSLPITKRPAFEALVSDKHPIICVNDEYEMFEQFKGVSPANDGMWSDFEFPPCGPSHPSNMNVCSTWSCPVPNSNGTVDLELMLYKGMTTLACPNVNELVTNGGSCNLKTSSSSHFTKEVHKSV